MHKEQSVLCAGLANGECRGGFDSNCSLTWRTWPIRLGQMVCFPSTQNKRTNKNKEEEEEEEKKTELSNGRVHKKCDQAGCEMETIESANRAHETNSTQKSTPCWPTGLNSSPHHTPQIFVISQPCKPAFRHRKQKHSTDKEREPPTGRTTIHCALNSMMYSG